MSAIFGIVRFDGAAVSGADIERMGGTMAHRGADGLKSVVTGPAGLGHGLLRVNHEDRFERQPLRDHAAGLTLVADCRIDNREELAGILRIDFDELRDMPDSALVLRAYRQWGESCPAHLVGDFAFAVWDGRAQKLFLARDHMGQRYVHYYRGDGFLAFATELKGLLTLADVPQRLSETFLGGRLMFAQEGLAGMTIFDGILGVPGGSTLSVDAAGSVALRRYWEPQADPAHVGRDETYYIDAYRRVLEEAVTCRLRRTTQPAALFFSGGFDSGAIAGLAGPVVRAQNRKLVAVVSAAPQGDATERDPQPWIDTCRRDMPHLDLRYATCEGRDILTDLERSFLSGDGLRSPNRYMYEDMHRQAAAGGARVLMDGHGGDYTLNPRGHKALARMLATGQWRRFAREIGPWRRHWRRSIYGTFRGDIVDHWIRPLVALRRRHRFGLPLFGPAVPITGTLARKAKAAGAVPKPFGLARGSAMRQVMIGTLRAQQSQASSSGSVAAAEFGLVFTQPFHDKRVVELALAIPEDLYVKDGRPRHLARAALADLYPREFAARGPVNTHMRPDFLPMLNSALPRVLRDIDRMENDATLAQYFDFARMRRMLTRASTIGDPAIASTSRKAALAFLSARYVEWLRRSNR